MSKQMINHRGEEFGRIINEVTANLKKLFQTEGDVFLLTGSGTGGLEAAIVNTLSPGDKVLSVSIGAFGDRFATIAETFGAEVVHLRFEWGKAADAGAVRQALRAEPGIKAVLVTHNETSTGVTMTWQKSAMQLRSLISCSWLMPSAAWARLTCRLMTGIVMLLLPVPRRVGWSPPVWQWSA